MKIPLSWIEGLDLGPAPELNNNGVILSGDTRNYRFAAGVLRPSWSSLATGTNISWEWINNTDHTYTYFNAVPTVSGSVIEVTYPLAKRVISLVAVADETFARKGIWFGASVGVASATIIGYTLGTTNLNSTGNGTGWSSPGSGYSMSWSSGVSTLTFPTASVRNDNWAMTTNVIYCGTNNRVIRPVLSGLPVGGYKFEMWDASTNTKIVTAPDANDKVQIIPPMATTQVNLGQFDGSNQTEHMFDATTAPAMSSGNIWVMGIFEIEFGGGA